MTPIALHRAPLTPSFWWAIASLPLMIVGALGPWAQVLGSRIDGIQDEVVLVLALVSSVALVALAGSQRYWLALFPLLAGASAAVLSAEDLRNVGHITSHVNTQLTTIGWGLYLTAIGSISLAIASMLIIAANGPTWLRENGFRLRSVRPAAPDAHVARNEQRDEVRRRMSYFTASAPETPYLAVRAGEETYFVATDDLGVSKALFLHGSRKDQETLRQVVARLRVLGIERPSEAVFVEVGANIGSTTIPAMRRHRFRSAVVVEASPENFRLLRVNLTANDLDDRVQAIAAAAHDSEGEVAFEVTSAQRGSHRVAKPHVKEEKRREIVTVPAVTLDGLVAEGVIDPASVGLLWIDAPRHEAQVMLGASSLIEAGVPIVAAIRVAGRRGDPRRPWNVPAEAKERLLEGLGSSYTDVVVLTWATPLDQTRPISELRSTVDSFTGTKDILLVRR